MREDRGGSFLTWERYPREDARNQFHQPPMHVACAESVRAGDEVVVTTAGFEFVRPDRDDPDRSPRFEPNSRV